MKTKDLIKALQELDPEKEVAMLFDGGFDPIKEVKYDDHTDTNFIIIDE